MKNIFYILSLMLIVSVTLTSCKKEEKEKRIDTDSGYYIGEVNSDGKAHGYGVFYWNNGNRYEGEWANGHLTGKGTYYWACGDKYEGDFVNGERTGKGTMTWKDGTTITCQWSNGTPTDVDNKTFAIWAIKYWYYWNNTVGVINLDYYNSASALLEAVKYRDDYQSEIYDADRPDELYLYGREIGYGFGARWNATGDLRVAWVYPDGPAAKQGITRGCRITEINGATASEQNTDNLITEAEGASVNITVEYPGGETKSIALASQKHDITSVLYKEVIQTPSSKVGYIVLKSLVSPNENEINNAINTLANSNIQELILDLRYCDNSSLSTFINTANMLVPSAADGKVFLKCTYNQDRATNVSYLFTKTNSLNMSRIIVLTSKSTYYAGEWLILGLQPYCNMVLIGSKTDGTEAHQYLSWTLPSKREKIALTGRLVENSAGRNSLGGLQPNYSAADGLDRNWGNREESLLQSALSFIEKGYVKSSGENAFMQSTLPLIHEPNSRMEALPPPEEIIKTSR